MPTWRRLRIALFRLVLRLSTPAHKFFGLGYDAGVAKELIPVEFTRDGVRVTLPELEIVEPPPVRHEEPAEHSTPDPLRK